jgi:hypothetical protein
MSIARQPRWGVVVGLTLVVVLAGACGSSGDSSSASPDASIPGGTTPTNARVAGTTVLPLDGGHVLVAAEVTCHLAKREQSGIIGSDEGRVETSCTERHNEESFTLSGTDELDDCYRAVAASSDVAIGPDSFDPAKLDFADEQITGHTFTTPNGALNSPDGVRCAIDLRDDRSIPLLGGAS